VKRVRIAGCFYLLKKMQFTLFFTARHHMPYHARQGGNFSTSAGSRKTPCRVTMLQYKNVTNVFMMFGVTLFCPDRKTLLFLKTDEFHGKNESVGARYMRTFLI
jgi:hypothetical protein